MSACDKIRSKGKTFYALRRSYIATIYELCAQNIRFDNEKAQKVVYAARAALLRLQHWSSDSLSFHPGLCHPAHGDPLHRTPLRRRESPALPPVGASGGHIPSPSHGSHRVGRQPFCRASRVRLRCHPAGHRRTEGGETASRCQHHQPANGKECLPVGTLVVGTAKASKPISPCSSSFSGPRSASWRSI